MGEIKKHLPVKLVCALLFKEEETLKRTKTLLMRHFGSIDFESAQLLFTYTSYYEKEFGKSLLRQFISFHRLIPPQELSRIKIITSAIEQKCAPQKRRCVNIDPGYIELSKFVLASTKDYAHRIYLGKGIFAEITLLYQDKTFKPWAWTYPDYRTPAYITVLNTIRQLYAQQMEPAQAKTRGSLGGMPKRPKL